MNEDYEEYPARGRLVERVANLEEEIKQLQAERRWIPVSERLPEGADRVLGANAEYGIVDSVYHEDGVFLAKWVTHWMPLPPPPEGE